MGEPQVEECLTQCRYCQDVEPRADLIQPCNCKGTLAYAHIQCIKQWADARLQRLTQNLDPCSIGESIELSRTCELCQSTFVGFEFPPINRVCPAAHQIVFHAGTANRIIINSVHGRSFTYTNQRTLLSEKFCWMIALILSLFLLGFTVLQYTLSDKKSVPEHRLLISLIWFVLGLIWFGAFMRRLQIAYGGTSRSPYRSHENSSGLANFFTA